MRGLLAMLLASVPSVALAGVTNITVGSNYASISQAINASSPGHVLVLDAGTYPEAVSVPHDLTFVGAGVGSTIIEGIASTSVVDQAAVGVSIVMEDLTVQSSLVGQQLISVDAGGGTLTLRRVALLGGDAPLQGGAVHAVDAQVLLEEVLIEDSEAGQYGGGVYGERSGIDATDLTVRNTSASRGGGIYLRDGSVLTCRWCTLDRTDAVYGAGLNMHGIGAASSSVLENTTFCEVSGASVEVSLGTLSLANVSVFGGAGVVVRGTSNLEVQNSAFFDYGIDFDGDTYDIVNSVFHGGGIGLLVSGGTGDSRYNLFHDLTYPELGESTWYAVHADPEWWDYTPDGDCFNDELGPLLGSPLIDAGDPAILDPDGSTSDIGPHAGTLAGPLWFTDTDGDAAPDHLDCEPAVPTIGQFEDEYCDGIDNDCDGVIDQDGAVDATDWYEDQDGDGLGGNTLLANACSPPLGAVPNSLDCDDQDALVGQREWKEDMDLDGFGGGLSQFSCFSPGAGWFNAPFDCDDTDPAIHPGANESCSNVDEDCDGDPYANAIDAVVWSADFDGDGHGSEVDRVVACLSPGPDWIEGFGQDCDDTNAAVNHDAVEVCDGIDNNCFLGEYDAPTWQVWYVDGDGDGFGVEVGACEEPPNAVPMGDDCDDADVQVFPGQIEFCDAVDNDCDGVVDNPATTRTWYLDRDEDQHHSDTRVENICWVPEPGWVETTLGSDCDDDDPLRGSTLAEVCDGIDNDCDERTDEEDPDLVDGVDVWLEDADADGYGEGDSVPSCTERDQILEGGDCDSDDPEVNPGATEIPGNDVDEDCDGVAEPAPEVPDDRKKDRGEPEASGCGCDASTGPLGAVGWLALLPLIGLRRR